MNIQNLIEIYFPQQYKRYYVLNKLFQINKCIKLSRHMLLHLILYIQYILFQNLHNIYFQGYPCTGSTDTYGMNGTIHRLLDERQWQQCRKKLTNTDGNISIVPKKENPTHMIIKYNLFRYEYLSFMKLFRYTLQLQWRYCFLLYYRSYNLYIHNCAGAIMQYKSM